MNHPTSQGTAGHGHASGHHGHAAAHHGHEHNEISHVAPVKVLIGVFVALLALTALTVAAVRIDLGALNIWIAMGIATVKATLVALYFMHLKYDRPFNAMVFLASLVFAGLFVAIALLDSREYQPSIQSYNLTHPGDARPIVVPR
jgi:cytochrome c oxidase subunit IV